MCKLGCKINVLHLSLVCSLLQSIGFVETKIYPFPDRSYHCGGTECRWKDWSAAPSSKSKSRVRLIRRSSKCCDDEWRQFCQRYQFPHSSKIERRFEVLVLQIRGCRVRHWISSETFRKILVQIKAPLSLKGQDNDLLVVVGGCGAAHHVQETMISSTFFELGTCQRPKTMEAGGMTVPRGTMYESLNEACFSCQVEDWGDGLNKGNVIVKNYR